MVGLRRRFGSLKDIRPVRRRAEEDRLGDGGEERNRVNLNELPDYDVTAEDKLHSKVTAQANSLFVSADAFGECEALRVRAPNAARPIVPWGFYPSSGGSSVRKTSE